MPRELDTSRLQRFTPRARKSQKLQQSKVQKKASETDEGAWPSREVSHEGQFTIRAPMGEIARFRKICKDDRRTYADMLRILMDSFEKGSAP